MNQVKDAELLPPAAVAGPENGTALAATGADSIRGLIEIAIEKSLPVESLERFQAMYERAVDRQAERDLVAALAAFQAECPPIRKTKSATKAGNEGGARLYSYAPLEEIAVTIRPFLRARGLSYSWDMEESPGGLKVTCVVSHTGGASKRSTFSTPLTAGTSIMSAPQKQAATNTYAKRQALIAALGLTTCDEDFDGADRGGPEGDGAILTDEQAAILDGLLSETKSDRAKFCAWLKVDCVENIPAARYTEAVRMLERKRAGAPR